MFSIIISILAIIVSIMTVLMILNDKWRHNMNVLYKTTLLITMAVVTWKVMKIEVNTRKTTINFTNNKNVKTTRRFGSSQQKL